MPDITWFSLQKGPGAVDLVQENLQDKVLDLSAHLTDFTETAHAIGQLDLVISVDTAVAHLAGALGQEIWLLLPYVPDWRWMSNRKDSPWYPTMRLFRQRELGNWSQVFEWVFIELQHSTHKTRP